MPAKFTTASFARPGMKLALEIEDELGSIAALAARLAGGTWTAGELVTLVHILLQGAAPDWLALGDGMIAEGLSAHAAASLRFLNQILDGAKT